MGHARCCCVSCTLPSRTGISFKSHHKTYKAAKALQARIKVGLTGTPLQNNLEELWALLSIVAPRLAGSESEFKCVRSFVCVQNPLLRTCLLWLFVN